MQKNKVLNSYYFLKGQTMPHLLLLAADINFFPHRSEDSFLDLLPQAQAESIRKNRRSEDRRRRILARLLLGFGLSILENWNISTTLTALRQEPQGRPWLYGCSRPVSLSHAGRWAVCAIGPAQMAGGIGVDVEEIRLLDVEEFNMVFTPREREAIRQADNPASEVIRRWTIKEAMLKAQGTGLLSDPLWIDTEEDLETAPWRHISLEPGYWLTVAGQKPSAQVRLLCPSPKQLFRITDREASGHAVHNPQSGL